MAMATAIRITDVVTARIMAATTRTTAATMDRHTTGITATVIIIRDATTIGITGTGDKKSCDLVAFHAGGKGKSRRFIF